MKIKLLVGICFICTFVACMGHSNNKEETSVNPADTIYLGDLRDKFKDDSLFYAVVVQDLVLTDNQYCWMTTEKDAIEKGLSKEYYKKVKKEISATNEAIRQGVMKGANIKRIPDFQKNTNLK
ncbi:hypothetical protein [Bacteroides xylanisolvens]|uniref:hypothetical protein n=1 Tax=Bacteroides TaxID=816 RepID=UPI003D185AA3